MVFIKMYSELRSGAGCSGSSHPFGNCTSNYSYTVHHFDTKTAFVKDEDLDEIIVKKQLPGFEIEGEEQQVRLLQKCLYYLKQAARA